MLKTQVPAYFKARRERLMKASPSAAFVFPSAREHVRNPDVTFPYRQESNFHYLSGFEEPESFLVICPAASAGGSFRTVLFVRERDPEKELWEGERYGVDRAGQIFGADEVYPAREFSLRMRDLLKGADRVYYRIGLDAENDVRMTSVLESVRHALGRSGRGLLPVHDPGEVLGEMRLVKGPEEIDLIRKAAKISAAAHLEAMKQVRPGMNEYEVDALVSYVFRKSGCQREGYGSIIAGGKHATCLHYRDNNAPLREGDLLLIDAGGEFDHYTADITRTFPVARRFSTAQARIYDLVLKSQKEAIALARPGIEYTDLHTRVCEVLTDGLLSLGCLKGDPKEIIKNMLFKRFFPHGTGHWLGIDVHDVGLYRVDEKPRILKPGMVFTVEPGLYFQPSDMEAPAEFRDIGIRIEDDLLITEGGHEVLTSGAPKEREEIEAIRGRA